GFVAGGGSGGCVVCDSRTRSYAAGAVRPDGVGELLHGPQRCVSVPADGDLPAIPGRSDARGRRRPAWLPRVAGVDRQVVPVARAAGSAALIAHWAAKARS